MTDWTDAEISALLEMKARKMRVRQIALALGRSPDAVQSRIRYEKMTSEERMERNREARQRAYANGVKARNRSTQYVQLVSRVEPPDYVLAERDARMSAPQTIGSILMGDPPPGYSALDRRA